MDLERRIGLVRERCSLTAFGAFALELLLLAEWDPDLNGTNGIYPDELFQAWEKNGPNAEAGGKTDRAELDKEIRTIAGRNVEAASGRIIYRIREQVLRFIEQEFPPDPDEFFLEIFSNFEKAEEPDPERSVYRGYDPGRTEKESAFRRMDPPESGWKRREREAGECKSVLS